MNRYRKHMIYSNGLEKYLSKPIPVFLICKKQKHRQEKHRLKLHWKEFVARLWPCSSSDDLDNVATVLCSIKLEYWEVIYFPLALYFVTNTKTWLNSGMAFQILVCWQPFYVPLTWIIFTNMYDQWKAGVELFSIVIPEDYIADHFELMLELPSVKAVWEGSCKAFITPIPTWEIDYGASIQVWLFTCFCT